MAKLYDLQSQLVAIDDILENNTDQETQEILESAREELLQAVDNKIENILNFMADCKGKVEQLKAEEERIYKKRKALENKTEYLKNMVFWFMKSNNQQKAEFGTYNCTIAKTTPKIVIDDEHLIPAEFIKTTISVDKTALKQKMTDGKYIITFDGVETQVAHTEESECLRIK